MTNYKKYISKMISDAIQVDENEVVTFIETPKDKDNGDLAFPCFRLAKILKKSPQEIAIDIKEKIAKLEEQERKANNEF